MMLTRVMLINGICKACHITRKNKTNKQFTKSELLKIHSMLRIRKEKRG